LVNYPLNLLSTQAKSAVERSTSDVRSVARAPRRRPTVIVVQAGAAEGAENSRQRVGDDLGVAFAIERNGLRKSDLRQSNFMSIAENFAYDA
jgi:hypothetical protein